MIMVTAKTTVDDSMPVNQTKYTNHNKIAPKGVGTPVKCFATSPASELILNCISGKY